MIIEFSDNSKMHAAISLANRRRYYDALCIFAQIESYESVLNQIACLVEMQDIGYAVDTYYYAKQTYGATHALYSDVVLLGGAVENLLRFCEPSSGNALSNDGSIHADRTLLVNVENSDEEDFSAPDLDYAADTFLYDDPTLSPNNFYDVKSPRYFDSLRVNMEKCIMDGDEAGAKKYAKRILDLETDHLPTLETQISLTLYTEKHKKGLPYVERLSLVEGGSTAAIGGAIEILMRLNPRKHVDLLKKLLHKASEIIDDILPYDLEDYVYLATDYLHDAALAYKFAEVLYKNYKQVNLEALHVCACAFFNFGNKNLAKDAALSFLHAMPKNYYAKILVEYVLKNMSDEQNEHLDIAPRVLRHFAIPTAVSLYAHDRLYALLDVQSQFVLTDEALFYLSVLMAHCKSLILTNRQKDYTKVVSFLRTLVAVCEFENVPQFLTFAKAQLLCTMPDQCMTETLIYRLINFGVQEKIDIGLPGSNYRLDFSQVNPTDALFSRAFSLCASLVRIDEPQIYAEAYQKIAAALPLDQKDENLVHKLAFAMFCVCIKNFIEMPEAEFFAESDYTLYREWRAAIKK